MSKSKTDSKRHVNMSKKRKTQTQRRKRLKIVTLMVMLKVSKLYLVWYKCRCNQDNNKWVKCLKDNKL